MKIYNNYYVMAQCLSHNSHDYRAISHHAILDLQKMTDDCCEAFSSLCDQYCLSEESIYRYIDHTELMLPSFSSLVGVFPRSSFCTGLRQTARQKGLDFTSAFHKWYSFMSLPFLYTFFFHPTKAAWLSPQGLAVRDLAFMPIVAFVSQPSAYDILTLAQKKQ